MAAISFQQILNWFKTRLKPTEQNFKDTFESFYNKFELIPVNVISGIVKDIVDRGENPEEGKMINQGIYRYEYGYPVYSKCYLIVTKYKDSAVDRVTQTRFSDRGLERRVSLSGNDTAGYTFPAEWERYSVMADVPDGKLYVRRNREWTSIDLSQVVTEVTIPDKIFGRMNGEWVEISQGLSDNSVFLNQDELSILLKGTGPTNVALCTKLLDGIVNGKDIRLQYHDSAHDSLLRDTARMVAVESVNFFKKSFVKGGFTDNSFQAWEGRQTPIGHGSRVMYVSGKSGNLRDSIRKTEESTKRVVVGTDKPYAEIHNEGGFIVVTARMKKWWWWQYSKLAGSVRTTKKGKISKSARNVGAGKKAEFCKRMALMKVGSRIKIPKRQFIGESKTLMNELDRRLNIKIKEYWGKA
ncbi:MAG: hypothetical protein LBJ17_05720 [Dysgonamonadaceae bacterium]|jgi:phage gpG-like protein|nr:hypothetical protein [Dysgonamonadaceae bacterium]